MYRKRGVKEDELGYAMNVKWVQQPKEKFVALYILFQCYNEVEAVIEGCILKRNSTLYTLSFFSLKTHQYFAKMVKMLNRNSKNTKLEFMTSPNLKKYAHNLINCAIP
jgi:hypothetical protein